VGFCKKNREFWVDWRFFCILAGFGVAALCNLSNDKTLRRLKFYFACKDNSVLLPNVLSKKKLCKISTSLSPKNFAKWLINPRKNKKSLIFQYWSGMMLNEIRLGGVRQAYIVS
jgi:hypothetical protein